MRTCQTHHHMICPHWSLGCSKNEAETLRKTLKTSYIYTVLLCVIMFGVYIKGVMLVEELWQDEVHVCVCVCFWVSSGLGSRSGFLVTLGGGCFYVCKVRVCLCAGSHNQGLVPTEGLAAPRRDWQPSVLCVCVSVCKMVVVMKGRGASEDPGNQGQPELTSFSSWQRLPPLSSHTFTHMAEWSLGHC